MRGPFGVAEFLCQTAADAVPERIAGGEHDRRTAPQSEHAAHIEGHRPGSAAITDPGQCQMTLSAEHCLGCSERLSACLREPGKAILAYADDGQPRIGLRIEPRISHDARPHPGRN